MKVPDPVVLWEGRGILVVNKPHNLLTHGAPGTDSVLARLQRHGELHACHRLDAGTAGALMLAKDPQSAARAQQLWEQRGVEKRYVAVVAGVPAFETRVVDAPLKAAPSRRKNEEADKPAATRIEVLLKGNGAALVAAIPEGGRFHQVRAHLASVGHPILGDRDHDGPSAPVLALHAVSLAFRWEGDDVTVEAPVWEAFVRVTTRAGMTTNQKGMH